jgi:2-oxoglutarate ferredoxin oxidoreductase subunit gamma
MAEIRFAGYGGQGIIRCGIIVTKGATIFDTKFATMNQSFGPEARGGACSSQMIISDQKILYPYVEISDVLVAMSQPGYDKFEPELGEDGLCVYDEDLVKPVARGKIRNHGIPSTRFAEELGHRIMANVVMLGFFTAVSKLVTKEAMEKAVADSVPGGLVDLNLKAFTRGYEHAENNSE